MRCRLQALRRRITMPATILHFGDLLSVCGSMYPQYLTWCWQRLDSFYKRRRTAVSRVRLENMVFEINILPTGTYTANHTRRISITVPTVLFVRVPTTPSCPCTICGSLLQCQRTISSLLDRRQTRRPGSPIQINDLRQTVEGPLCVAACWQDDTTDGPKYMRHIAHSLLRSGMKH